MRCFHITLQKKAASALWISASSYQFCSNERAKNLHPFAKARCLRHPRRPSTADSSPSAQGASTGMATAPPHRARGQGKRVTDTPQCCIRVSCAVVGDGVGHRLAVRAERGTTELEPSGCRHYTTHGRGGRAVLPELDTCRQRLGIGDRHRHSASAARGLEGVFPIGHRRSSRGGVGQAGKAAGGIQCASSAATRKRCCCRT